jgi:glycosyltransferase involved in cell wall biosynthesis
MDVLAFPSYREGLPNVPLEAQLCGVPVVGYAATGTVDAVADGVGGILVPVGDALQFGDELRTHLVGEHESPDVRRASAWVSERFDRVRVWQTLVEQYERSNPAR